jgi:NAD(P)-dependent dehydrogenase (short-subunit alcohol dehydrogenase family)
MRQNKILEQFRLDGENAVVTGGCGKLGPWWVKTLVEAGGEVVIIDLPGTKIPETLVKLPKQSQKRIKFYEADITDLRSLSAAHKLIKKEMGLVQILVNNAGIDIPPVKCAEVVNPDELLPKYRKMWDVNVQGIVNCIEEFKEDMIKNGGGSIINIGSLYSERSPFPGLYDHLGFDKPWAYGSTKAAVDQLTRHYATRLARYGIRVNTLSPGGVLDVQDKEFVRKYSARVPLGRMVQKEKDLGGPLIFLASAASNYITGINLQVNGGYTAW